MSWSQLAAPAATPIFILSWWLNVIVAALIRKHTNCQLITKRNRLLHIQSTSTTQMCLSHLVGLLPWTSTSITSTMSTTSVGTAAVATVSTIAMLPTQLPAPKLLVAQVRSQALLTVSRQCRTTDDGASSLKVGSKRMDVPTAPGTVNKEFITPQAGEDTAGWNDVAQAERKMKDRRCGQSNYCQRASCATYGRDPCTLLHERLSTDSARSRTMQRHW